jgi:carbamoyl-phosphate synthase small subunit
MTARPEALLVLEDGATFRGEGFGSEGTAFGEVVFNTALTGYQEVLTDPSYHRQLVTMTYPHQGNYGLTAADDEADGIQVAGFIVREVARVHSSWRAERSLEEALRSAGVVGITEVDTRRLTRHIRSAGALRGVITTESDDVEDLLRQVNEAPKMEGAELASEVTAADRYEWAASGPTKHRVVAVDFGLKRNQLRLLAEHGCDVVVVPVGTPAEEILAIGADGVFLSNGPGDPAAVKQGIETIKVLLGERVPTFGICLGHQLLGLSVGAKTYKLPFGHHGVNQPVRNIERGTVEIASHNHGFAIDRDSLPGPEGPFGAVTETHVNLNDGTNSGIRCVDVPAFSVQYHPESAPGPHDSRYLFDEFCNLMEGGR